MGSRGREHMCNYRWFALLYSKKQYNILKQFPSNLKNKQTKHRDKDNKACIFLDYTIRAQSVRNNKLLLDFWEPSVSLKGCSFPPSPVFLFQFFICFPLEFGKQLLKKVFHCISLFHCCAFIGKMEVSCVPCMQDQLKLNFRFSFWTDFLA